MNPDQLVSKTRTKLQTAQDHFLQEIKKLSTGRAHPGMLDGIMVEAYGVPTPIIQVGSVIAPEAQLLQITPFDPVNLKAICDAIRENQTLGLNPMDDGRVVRVQVPALTTERRQQIAKQLGKKVEDSMIAMRNVRHDAMKELDQLKKDNNMSNDELKRLQNQIDELMSERKTEIDRLSRAKEQEIMTL